MCVEEKSEGGAPIEILRKERGRSKKVPSGSALVRYIETSDPKNSARNSTGYRLYLLLAINTGRADCVLFQYIEMNSSEGAKICSQ